MMYLVQEREGDRIASVPEHTTLEIAVAQAKRVALKCCIRGVLGDGLLDGENQERSDQGLLHFINKVCILHENFDKLMLCMDKDKYYEQNVKQKRQKNNYRDSFFPLCIDKMN